MPVTFKPKPPHGLRKYFRKFPHKRTEWYRSEGKVLPYQGEVGILGGGASVDDIHANVQAHVRQKLNRFNPKIVNMIMELNPMIFVFHRDGVRNFVRFPKRVHPNLTIFPNLFVAGRKGDTRAVREMCDRFEQEFRRRSLDILKGKIKIVDDESTSYSRVGKKILERDIAELKRLSPILRYIRLHPTEFCKAVKIAFSTDFDPKIHTRPEHELN